MEITRYVIGRQLPENPHGYKFALAGFGGTGTVHDFERAYFWETREEAEQWLDLLDEPDEVEVIEVKITLNLSVDEPMPEDETIMLIGEQDGQS